MRLMLPDETNTPAGPQWALQSRWSAVGVYRCDEFVMTSQTPPPGTGLRRYETVIVESAPSAMTRMGYANQIGHSTDFKNAASKEFPNAINDG